MSADPLGSSSIFRSFHSFSIDTMNTRLSRSTFKSLKAHSKDAHSNRTTNEFEFTIILCNQCLSLQSLLLYTTSLYIWSWFYEWMRRFFVSSSPDPCSAFTFTLSANNTNNITGNVSCEIRTYRCNVCMDDLLVAVMWYKIVVWQYYSGVIAAVVLNTWKYKTAILPHWWSTMFWDICESRSSCKSNADIVGTKLCGEGKEIMCNLKRTFVPWNY